MISETFSLPTVDGKAVLRGQIDFPDRAYPQRLPCILVISGSGPQDREGYFGDSGTEQDLVYREISRALTAEGFAVLRWDYRGVFGNEMTMPGREACRTPQESALLYLKTCLDARIRSGVTPENILEDVETVYLKAKDHPRVDPERLVVLAHSEGVTNIARLVCAARIAPKGILALCGITTSPVRVLRWQCVDRCAAAVLAWDRDGDGRITRADVEAGLKEDTFFSMVGFTRGDLMPAGAWDERALYAFFEGRFEAWKEETLATPDDTPYPRPSAEPGLVMGSYRWFKRYFLDDRQNIELLQKFGGGLVFHFGALDSQLPAAAEHAIAAAMRERFDGRLRLVMHEDRGHTLRTGHPLMGPMDPEAIRELVADIVALA